ncbi:hypothetical protein [Bacillus sp. 37MA]|uniref:hypothetical protein n=1 Tax=Bacillus sp. 37MA TaxID=1132442 RepID=UPI00035C739B|nr:hypothetical protein [Bacillus sp. 37MA]
MYAEEVSGINNDRTLSEVGKEAARTELKQKYGREFIEIAKKLRDDYDKAVVKAQTQAEVVLNAEPSKPDAITIKSFERELQTLKMNVMLGTNPETSIQAINEFAAKQKEPYLAKQIAGEFADLATNVINGSGNSPQVKQKLSGVYQAVSEKAMMPEQQKALEIAGYVSEAVGRLLFRDKSIEIEALDRIIGPEFTRHANKPHLYVDPEAKAE